jgi:hypothetical protein
MIAKQEARRTRLYSSLIADEAATKITKWLRIHFPLYMLRTRGQGVYIRDLLTNDSDFFSAEPFTDLSGSMFFSYKDADNHIYGFDIRSIHTLIYRARLSGESPINPYTRNTIPSSVLGKVNGRVKSLQKRGIPTEWAPLEPPTPVQQWRMKVVDLFNKIDELNYYSSPDWFISLDIGGQRRFYTELHAIWTHRAGLSMMQKNTIVPNFSSKLFRHPPWAIMDQSLESMQKMNMNTIRILITSAEDKNDRILGAMYVVSTLTLVSREARNAYPWLYESVGGIPEVVYANERRHGFDNMVGLGWLQELLNQPLHNIPPLRLSPDSDDNV